MSVAHTPGPWAGDTETGRIYFADADVFPTIAEVNLDGCTYPGQGEADVRLIAAAPDLLAALQHILAGAVSLPRFAEEEARAAIARATPAEGVA